MLRDWLCPIVYLWDQDRAAQESSEIICPQRRKINMSDRQAKLFVRFLGGTEKAVKCSLDLKLGSSLMSVCNSSFTNWFQFVKKSYCSEKKLQHLIFKFSVIELTSWNKSDLTALLSNVTQLWQLYSRFRWSSKPPAHRIDTYLLTHSPQCSW